MALAICPRPRPRSRPPENESSSPTCSEALSGYADDTDCRANASRAVGQFRVLQVSILRPPDCHGEDQARCRGRSDEELLSRVIVALTSVVRTRRRALEEKTIVALPA